MLRLCARLVFALAASPVLACSAELYALMDAPLTGEGDITLDVAEIASAEGGAWRIWHDEGEGAQQIVRNDYGETGQLEHRLSIAAPDAYGVVVTRSIYSAPIYIARSTTIRTESDIYIFCGGDLLVPADDMGPGPDYPESALVALSAFAADEIKPYADGLIRP